MLSRRYSLECCTSSERLSGIYTKIMSDGVGSCVEHWIVNCSYQTTYSRDMREQIECDFASLRM
jgi:hypothetical protein